MTDRDWQTVWDLYDQARQLTPDAQHALIRTAEPAIADKVRMLLRQPRPAPTPRCGPGIGRYLITGVLGRGSLSETFSARDVELDRPAALKFFKQPRAEDTAAVEQFLHEAKAASALSHPNIVTVFEVVRSPQGAAIAMELVQGQVLGELRGTSQPLARVLRIGEQMAAAMAAAHAAGIVHRDLKPENIMVRADGYVKILDFGLGRHLDTGSISQSGLPGSSFRYMPPEQFTGDALTPASDVFSMGVILFELAAGFHPFPAATPLEALAAMRGPAPMTLARANPHVPAELSNLVRQMLLPDAAARPTALQVAARLKLLTNPNQEPSPPRAIARRSALRQALAGAAVAGAGTLGWKWLRGGGAESTAPLEAVAVLGAPSALEPAISPDGQSTAFVSLDGGRVILVKEGSGEPVRLAQGNHEQASPTWSPDGRSIAFLQAVGVQQVELRIAPAAGGSSRKVAEFTSPPLVQFWFPGPLLAWSRHPDWLVVSRRSVPGSSFCLFLVHAATGEWRQLTDPRGVEGGDTGPAFSPDGRTLAFARVADEFSECHIYVMPLSADVKPAGPPRKLETGSGWNTCPAWTADGRELIFSSGTFHATHLARIAPFAAQARATPVAEVGEFGWTPALTLPGAIGGPRLTYVRRINTSAIWKLGLTNRSGLPAAARKPVRIVPALGMNQGPVCAPASPRFAYLSTRSGFPEVWVSALGGGEPEQWTNLRSPEISDLRWLGDRRVMFDVLIGGAKVRYTVGAPPDQPRQLFPEAVRSGVASPDGKWVYYLRRRSPEIWRRAADGEGEAVRVTEDSGYNFQIAPDGNTIYYAKVRDAEVWVWAVNLWAPSAGGRAPQPLISMTDSFCPGRRGIYFVPQSGSARLAYFDFATRATTALATPPEVKPRYLIGLAADESALLYSESEFDSSTLMTVRHFR